MNELRFAVTTFRFSARSSAAALVEGKRAARIVNVASLGQHRSISMA